MVETVYPLERGQFHVLLGFPRRTAVDQLGLIQAVDRLCQCIVVAVTATAGSMPAGLPLGGQGRAAWPVPSSPHGISA